MLVLRSLDQEARVVVLEVVLRVGYYYCRHLHRGLDHLLQVALGRLVDMAGYMEVFPFLFLCLLGGSGTVSDYFLHLDRKLVVRPRPLFVRGSQFLFEVTMAPCEWVKKDWWECRRVWVCWQV